MMELKRTANMFQPNVAFIRALTKHGEKLAQPHICDLQKGGASMWLA